MGLLNDGLLFSLYALEKSSSSPEIKTFAYMALYQYLHGAQGYTIKEKYAFERHHLLLTESELSQLLHEAACPEFTKGNLEEALLLRDALKRANTASLLADMCLVPAFKNLLKSKYPHAEKITTAAYCLWAAASQASLMVSIAEPSDAPFVAKSLEPRPTIEDLVLPIKKGLENIVPQELRIPEPLVENSSEIEPSLSWLSEIGEELKTFELKEQRLDALERFRKRYEQRFAKDRATCCFGFFYRSRLNLTKTSLNDIFDHAFRNQGHRTRSVLDGLGWLDAHGQIEATIRVLIDYECDECERLNFVPLGN